MQINLKTTIAAYLEATPSILTNYATKEYVAENYVAKQNYGIADGEKPSPDDKPIDISGSEVEISEDNLEISNNNLANFVNSTRRKL